MVATRRSSKETIGKSPLLPLRVRTPARPSVSTVPTLPLGTNTTPTSKPDASSNAKLKRDSSARRFRCSAHTSKGTRCRLTCQENGGTCPIHSVPACLHDERCSICLDSFDDKSQLCKKECGHYFHKACIAKWLEDHHTCPVCRHELKTPVPAQRIHMLHLLFVPFMAHSLAHGTVGFDNAAFMDRTVGGENVHVQYLFVPQRSG